MSQVIERTVWAANGAAGWATLAMVASVTLAVEGDFKEAAACAAWTPLGFVAGGIAGLLGLPTFFGPLDILATLKAKCPQEPRW